MDTTSGEGDGVPVVLVVDDQREVLELARFALTRAGFRAVTAESAQAGLEVLRLALPDAIVLDLGMPDMGGWAFRAAQLTVPGAAGIPVVVFTGNADVVPPTPDLAPAAVVHKPAVGS